MVASQLYTDDEQQIQAENTAHYVRVMSLLQFVLCEEDHVTSRHVMSCHVTARWTVASIIPVSTRSSV
jgi:hypothetical protein